MSLLFFKLVEEFGGRPVIIVRKYDVPPASRQPYIDLVRVYDVSMGFTLIIGWISIYSENEVAKGKLLIDRAPSVLFPDAIWGNNQIIPVGLIARTDVTFEITNETPQVDRIWIKIIGAEIPADRLGEFFNRLKQYGFPC